MFLFSEVTDVVMELGRVKPVLTETLAINARKKQKKF